MMATRASRLGIVLGLAVAVGLPVLGRWLRRPVVAGCALDGAEIVPQYRVGLTDAAGQAREFCCVRCAELWLQRQAAPPRSITVTDEATGQEMDAAAAIYVRSLVVTNRATSNRVHVFANRADAERHAATYRGTVLDEMEKPFRTHP
jgi:endogenous inhibitor of DNA gyrase (YacG/DUF329 family)